MPVRPNAKGPGEFVRDHLQEPQTGGRDYVGSMYQAYKEHLRSASFRRHPQDEMFSPVAGGAEPMAGPAPFLCLGYSSFMAMGMNEDVGCAPVSEGHRRLPVPGWVVSPTPSACESPHR